MGMPKGDRKWTASVRDGRSMVDMVKSMKVIWLVAGFFAPLISPLQAQKRKDITVTQLLSSTVTSSGQPIVLPQKGAQIVVSIYDMVPGARHYRCTTIPIPATDTSYRETCA
jgi:hypothetical protein